MATTQTPRTPGGARVRESAHRGGWGERDAQYDLLTAALIGVAVGVGATLLFRGGAAGARRAAPMLRAAGAIVPGRRRRGAARRAAAWARKRGEAMGDAAGGAGERVQEYLESARDRINETVESELHDLRKAIRRQRRKLGL